MDMITNPSMAWLPPVILASIVAIAALIGFWNGWKTAVYFLGWNVVGFAAVLITMATGYSALVNFVPDDLDMGGISIKDLLVDNQDTIKPLGIMILTIVVLLVTNFIAFLLYWIFRGKLKRSIKKAKADGTSNFNSRFFGATIGVITALPIALSATMLSTVVSPTNKFTNFTSDVYGGLTAGQAKDSDENIRETIDLADTIDKMNNDEQLQKDVSAALMSAFIPDGSKGIKTIPSESAMYKHLTRILNSPIVANSMSAVMGPLGLDEKKFKLDELAKINKKLFAEPVVTNKDQQKRLVKAITKQFSETQGAAAEAKVEAFLTKINVFG